MFPWSKIGNVYVSAFISSPARNTVLPMSQVTNSCLLTILFFHPPAAGTLHCCCHGAGGRQIVVCLGLITLAVNRHWPTSGITSLHVTGAREFLKYCKTYFSHMVFLGCQMITLVVNSHQPTWCGQLPYNDEHKIKMEINIEIVLDSVMNTIHILKGDDVMEKSKN